MSRSNGAPVAAPDPGQSGTLDELIAALRSLKVWAGDPSYTTIKDRINTAWRAAGRPGHERASRTTIADCFQSGRRRVNTDLVIAIVTALHPDVGYVSQWRQAMRVIAGETRAAAQVRVEDELPPDVPGFTGRTADVDRLVHELLHSQRDGGAIVLSAIAGMAGVGKTQLAIRVGRLVARQQRFKRTLFVNLRGFDPDLNRPPADPAAVLEGFLRLLGVPGDKIPYDLSALTAAYRDRLSGTQTLIVLDNASSEEQVRPLLSHTPGCPVLITSRRSLTELHPATHVTLDVFAPDEALAYLAVAAAGVPLGTDPDAAARIAERCGHLPLALALIAAHMCGTTGWTMTDHADRLDARYRDGRLDTGVALAFDASYQQLPVDRRRLLRLLALSPIQDFDAHAAAALVGSDPPAAQALLRHLCGDHMVTGAGGCDRYVLHDLIRAYAADRAGDEDPPSERHAALTRLFDYCLATAATAMDTLYPAETHRRPRVPGAGTPMPALTDPDAARAWLDAERQTLVTVAAHAATQGWPTHATRMSTTLVRYLQEAYLADAIVVHGHAHAAAQQISDPIGQAEALTSLGVTHARRGQNRLAADDCRQALALFRRADDLAGQARVLNNLGVVELRLGDHQSAADRHRQALHLHRLTGDRTGEASALNNLGNVELRLGEYRLAADHYEQALRGYRLAGHRTGEASTLTNLGDMELRLGQYGSAKDHLTQALILFREIGNRDGEAAVLDHLGVLHTRLDQPARATEYHLQALEILRESGYRDREAEVLNSLGEAACSAGRPVDGLAHYTEALTVAIEIGDRHQQARAHIGLGHIHHRLHDAAHARLHYEEALAIDADLETSRIDEIRAHLAALDGDTTQSAGR